MLTFAFALHLLLASNSAKQAVVLLWHGECFRGVGGAGSGCIRGEKEIIDERKMWYKSDLAFEEAYCWRRCYRCNKGIQHEDIVPFRPRGFGIVCLPRVIAGTGHPRSQISRHIALLRLNTETRPFSGGMRRLWFSLSRLTLWQERVKALERAWLRLKHTPVVPSCGGDRGRRELVPRVPPAAGALSRCVLPSYTPSELCQPLAPWRPPRTFGHFWASAFVSEAGGLDVASDSPLETFFGSLRDSVAVCTVRFTSSVFYKLTWELKCKANRPFLREMRKLLCVVRIYWPSLVTSWVLWLFKSWHLQNPFEGTIKSHWGLISQCHKQSCCH